MIKFKIGVNIDTERAKFIFASFIGIISFIIIETLAFLIRGRILNPYFLFVLIIPFCMMLFTGLNVEICYKKRKINNGYM